MLNIFQALVYLILIITLPSLSGNVPLEKKKENQLFKNSFLKSECFPAQLLLITILLCVPWALSILRNCKGNMCVPEAHSTLVGKAKRKNEAVGHPTQVPTLYMAVMIGFPRLARGEEMGEDDKIATDLSHPSWKTVSWNECVEEPSSLPQYSPTCF